ncbi:MAG TPA: VCBS repeat-containing protein [Pyrinomonadaceae bacterium]|jgi:hypothetical protein
MLLFTASAFAQSPTFGRTDYPLLGNRNVVGDFNGDGKPDLAGAGGQAAAVMLGNGDGTFLPKVEYPLADWSQDAAAGDFNGDGKLDLVYTINNPEIGLSLLTGNGDGTFNAPVNFPNTSHFDSPAVVAADFDNDGRLDVVVAHQIACYTAPCVAARTISVLIGLGDGTFQPAREVEVGTGMSSIAVGDFNRDGLKDLGIAGDSSQVYVLLGAGNGTFNQQPTLVPIPDGNLGVDGTDIDIADFNGDTVPDLVVALALNANKTVVLIGNGDGTFRQPLIITEPGGRVPQYQAVADYNGDSIQDLAISLGWGLQGWMEILKGNGDGTFQPPVLYLVPDPKSSTSGGTLLTADFDADGKPDIALQFTGATVGTVALRNTTGAAPPATKSAPAAPTLISPAKDATVRQPATFDWSDVSGAVSYRIQIDDADTFPAPLVVGATVNVSQFTTDALPAQRLWWRVQAINSAGIAGSWSAARRFTAQASSPPPPTSAPTLSALALSPASVVGGNSAQGTVTLTGAAPAGGTSVTLSSSNASAATVPAGVTVAAGATSASFTVTTTSVTASTTVTIKALSGGVSRTATLTLTPQSSPPPPSGTLALTVTATGRGGERVLSSPTGIDVAVGSTATATFATGSAITLSVTNGRDAIWSGACSSGGSKAKTCRFTPTGNASVTANVQ